MKRVSIKKQVLSIVDYFRRNRLITVLMLLLLVVIISFGTVAAIRNGSKTDDYETSPSYGNGLIMEHFMLPKPTQEEMEVVSEEDVEDFMDDVNTDNEEALDLSQVEPHAVCVPYDGAVRAVSCWGDSMTFGVGVISGENAYPGALASLTGLTVYNMGGPGESSLEIATRQGAYGLHLDRDITVNEESSTLVNFISDYNGSVINFPNGNGRYTDASGYSDRANPINNIAGLCYIDGTPCVARYDGGSGMMAIRSCPEANALQLALIDTGNRRCSTLSSLTNGVFLSYLSEDSDNDVIAESQNQANSEVGTAKNNKDIAVGQTPAEKDTGSSTDATKGADTSSTTDTTTKAETESTTGNVPTTSSEPTTQVPTTQVPTTTQEPTTKVLTDISFASGTAVKTRASIDRTGDILILEIGSNGGWNSNYQVLINQYNRMIDSSGCNYFIIVGDTDDPGTSVGDQNQTDRDNNGNYIGVGDTAWEATLRKAYGEHFVNTRVQMIKNGLSYAGLDTTQNDLDGYVHGRISKQLRSDWTHLNRVGYYAKARIIYDKGVELGYWN